MTEQEKRVRSRCARAAMAFGVAAVLCASLPARAWKVDGTASPAELAAFHHTFGVASHLFPRHKAEPLGWTGFEVWVDTSFLPDYQEGGVSGNLPEDGLAVSRVGVRKGFPRGIDLGVALGRAGDVDLIDAELEWAILRGGVAQPALGVRLAAGRAKDDVYELKRWSAELVLSKGFGPVTPFVSAGVVRAEADFQPATGPAFGANETHEVLAAGVTLSLLLPRLTFSVEQAGELQFAVRAAIGF
jgi:hypothetical protein